MNKLKKFFKRDKTDKKETVKEIPNAPNVSKKVSLINEAKKVISKNKKKIILQKYSGTFNFIKDSKIYFLRKNPNGGCSITVRVNGVKESEFTLTFKESIDILGY